MEGDYTYSVGPQEQRRTRGWKLQVFWVSTSQTFVTFGAGQHQIRDLMELRVSWSLGTSRRGPLWPRSHPSMPGRGNPCLQEGAFQKPVEVFCRSLAEFFLQNRFGWSSHQLSLSPEEVSLNLGPQHTWWARCLGGRGGADLRLTLAQPVSDGKHSAGQRGCLQASCMFYFLLPGKVGK